jgi:predicted GH43/DUF377 family glycosyl hydrolase
MYALEPLGVVFAPSDAGWDCHAVAAPIVWRDDEGYHMLYQGWREKSGPRLAGLAESDDGLRWQRAANEPVMTPTAGSWDEGGFEAGCLLKISNEYHLYYSGLGPDGKFRIGLATSGDLRSWRKHAGNPILDVGGAGAWDERGVAFPSIHKPLTQHAGAPWRMTYGGYGERSMQIGTAFSNDGLTWEKHPQATFPQCGWFQDPDCRTWDAGIEVHHMIAVGDWYVMLYEGLGALGRYAIGVAFSPDAIVWARSARNPLWPLGACAVNQELSAVHPFLLQSDRLLYYVEVLQASAAAPHRVCAARLLDDCLIDPSAQPRLDFALWRDEEVGHEGLTGPAVPTAGFSRAAFTVLSSAPGRLAVEMDPAGLGEWQVIESAALAAQQVFRSRLEHSSGSVRLRCTPDRPAACSAWLSLLR